MTGRVIYRRVYDSKSGESLEVPEYQLDGKVVSKEEFDRAFPPKKAGEFGTMNYKRPLFSDALGVHPEQIPEAMEHDKKSGVVGVEYLPDGRAVFTSEAQMRKAMKAVKIHRNNCFY